MADDWMTDAHRAAALEGILSNPVAVAYAQQQAAGENSGGLALAGWHGHPGSVGMRVWFGEANGCVVQWAAKAPESGGPAEVFVRPILTPEVAGVELVDANGVQLNFSANYQGTAPAPAAETPDLVVWLHEQIYTARFFATEALNHWPPGDEIAEQVEPIEVGAFVHRNNPRALLAVCDAHAAVMRIHCDDGEGNCEGCHTFKWGEPWAPLLADCPTLRATALAYQYNEGYREEWRLDAE